MVKVICVLYDDPIDGHPETYARDVIPKLEQYPGGQSMPNPSAIDFTPGHMLGSVTGELGLRSFLEERGHTLVVTADKAALETAKALLMESRLRLEETRRLIEQGSRVAFNAYQIASDRMPQLSEALAAADEAAEAFPGQFELGERTLLDRLAVEDQMFAAETGILNGRAAVVLAHYQVLAAMGRLRDAF
jgi:hypothetical protein